MLARILTIVLLSAAIAVIIGNMCYKVVDDGINKHLIASDNIE